MCLWWESRGEAGSRDSQWAAKDHQRSHSKISRRRRPERRLGKEIPSGQPEVTPHSQTSRGSSDWLEAEISSWQTHSGQPEITLPDLKEEEV